MQSNLIFFPSTNKINEKANEKTTLVKAKKGYQNDILYKNMTQGLS